MSLKCPKTLRKCLPKIQLLKNVDLSLEIFESYQTK